MEMIPQPDPLLKPDITCIQTISPVSPKRSNKKSLLLFLGLLLFIVLVSGLYYYRLSQSNNQSQKTPSSTTTPTAASITPLSPTAISAPFKIGAGINIGYTESTKGWVQYKSGFYSIKYPQKCNIFKNGFVGPNKECDTCGGSPVGFNPQAKIYTEADKNLSLLDNAIDYTIKSWGFTDLTLAYPVRIISKSQVILNAIWVNGLPGETGHDILLFQSPEKDTYFIDFTGLYDVNENNNWVDKTYYGELLRKIFSTLEINQISPTPTP